MMLKSNALYIEIQESLQKATLFYPCWEKVILWLILNSCSLMREDATKIYENRLFLLFYFQKVFSKSSILHGFLGIHTWRFAWISVSFVSIWRILVLEFEISHSYIIMIHRMFWKHRLKGNIHSKKVNFATPSKQILWKLNL